MVDVEPGISVAEIDAAQFKAPTTDSAMGNFRALTQSYRVSVPAATKAT